MWFEINYKKLIILLLPTFLRQKRNVYWLQSLVTPLIQLHYSWRIKREQNLYKLRHNGQVCHLRKVLNDQFDPYERRIKITGGNRYKREYIYTQGEGFPKFLGEIYLRPSSDFADTGVDFIVLIPTDLIHNEYDLQALIDFYKLASKRYRIEKI